MQQNHVGQSIEALVCAFLEHNALSCVQKNFYCRLGEIDLVMFEASSNTLVFVEVRFRANSQHGNATESVDWKKQRKLKRAVLYYLQKHSNARQAARIDVIGVSRDNETLEHEHEHEHKIRHGHGHGHGHNNPHMNAESTYVFRGYRLVWTRNALED